MRIVERHIFDAGIGEIFDQRRFPDAFGQPEAARLFAETFLNEILHALDLADAVARREQRHDRLVKPAADHLPRFRPAAFLRRARCALRQAVEILGMMAFQPFEQTPGNVVRQGHARMLLEELDVGAITEVIRLFDDKIEVADGLMRMEQTDKAHGTGH